MIIQRRNFLIGLGAAIAAPAIVKAESLMKVKSTIIRPKFVEYYQGRMFWIADEPQVVLFSSTFEWKLGKVIPDDWRYCSRVANIPV